MFLRTSRKLTGAEKEYIREAINQKGWDGAFEEGWASAEESGDARLLQLILQYLRAKAALARYIGEDLPYFGLRLREYEQAERKAQKPSSGNARQARRRSRPSR